MAFSFKPSKAGFSQLSAALQGKGGGEEDPFLTPADLPAAQAAPQAMPQEAPQQQADPIAQLLAALGQSSGLTPQPQQAVLRQGPIMARRFGFGGAR